MHVTRSEADIRQTLIENNLIYGMLTLPSNMFYTVTLPATLWFFDKAKQDSRILFIDARNIFTQIDRAHREFSEEQIHNIAIISKLHKGNRTAFIRLIDSYFGKGMQLLLISEQQIVPISEKLLEVLGEQIGKDTVDELVENWQEIAQLQKEYQNYQSHIKGKLTDNKYIDKVNQAQQELSNTFQPFFKLLHNSLKQLDKNVRQHEKTQQDIAHAEGKRTTTDRKTKQLKEALEQLHQALKNAESFFKHINWLHERFPNAEYTDVIGLCKLATPDEVKEQDYSLNPGRYVGVVIEEDGKTEEEFISMLLETQDELEQLTAAAQTLEIIISKNIKALCDE